MKFLNIIGELLFPDLTPSILLLILIAAVDITLVLGVAYVVVHFFVKYW